MSRLPPLNALRAFETSARLGSFTRAADELHVTQAAVSQQVKQLEQHLGSPLFIREAKGLRLTEVGRSYQRRVGCPWWWIFSCRWRWNGSRLSCSKRCSSSSCIGSGGLGLP